MLSSELELCLNEAFQSAREARHEFMTVEHLLLAIIDTPKVREVLRACGADMVRLRKELQEFIDQKNSWAHLDIAATSWLEGEKPYLAKGATGVGLRTLLQLVRNLDK